MNSYIKRILVVLLFIYSISAFAQERLGANAAAASVTTFLTTLPLQPGSLNHFSDSDTEKLIALAAKLHINVFELLDCTFRYIQPLNIRISISGITLRNLQSKYDLGGNRVLAILPVDKLKYLEIGAVFTADQNKMDIFLDSIHESYIEIGTAYYETHCGFKMLSPLEFSQPFGISVKKLFLRASLERLELYEPGKGAIYVKGLSRPKRWNLDVITVKK